MSRPRTTSSPVDSFAAVIADLNARIRSLELNSHRHNTAQSALVPAGAIMETLWTTDPLGFLRLDGRTIVNGQTLYPALWAVAPGGWKSGSSLVLPTQAGKMVRAF
jgi:hypothetical protein